jgi:two-component system, OmpR family, sensor kinase
VTQYVHVAEADPVDPNPPGGPVVPNPPLGSVEPHPLDTDVIDKGFGARLRPRLPRTLTSRLVTGVVALVILVVGAAGSATYVALKHSLYQRLDQQLESTAHSPQIRSLINGTMPTRATLHGPQAVWIAILRTDGSVAFTPNSSDVKALSASANSRTKLTGSGDHPRSITTTDSVDLRVTSIANVFVDPTERPLVVVVGLNENEVHDTLRSLLLLELAIGAAGVALAAGLTIWGVRIGLGPLQRVTRTAQEVTAELSPAGAGLERRVPETDSSTEVGQLATSFNTMLDTVQTEFTARRESEERMRQFLADASHELRTPLTSIRGYAELARMQKARSDASGVVSTDDGADDTIGRIEIEGTRMSRLVEDLLILARGDDPNNNFVEHEVVELDDVVEDAITDLRLGYPDRTVTADIQPGLLVMGDRDQLLRVVRNLTGNAAVHADADGPIRVIAQRDGGNVVVQVIDAGPGLAPEEAAHVFERFWRADRARTRVRGGSGLGMAIVAQIVAAHGGRAFFDSSVPGGSTVTVVLPAIT